LDRAPGRRAFVRARAQDDAEMFASKQGVVEGEEELGA